MRTKLINDASEKTYVLILETGEEVVSQLQRFATICKRACDVTLQYGEPKIHLHVVAGKRDGRAHGGHLLQAYVRPILDIILTESPAYLKRTCDAASGLALIDIDGDGGTSRAT